MNNEEVIRAFPTMKFLGLTHYRYNYVALIIKLILKIVAFILIVATDIVFDDDVLKFEFILKNIIEYRWLSIVMIAYRTFNIAVTSWYLYWLEDWGFTRKTLRWLIFSLLVEIWLLIFWIYFTISVYIGTSSLALFILAIVHFVLFSILILRGRYFFKYKDSWSFDYELPYVWRLNLIEPFYHPLTCAPLAVFVWEGLTQKSIERALLWLVIMSSISFFIGLGCLPIFFIFRGDKLYWNGNPDLPLNHIHSLVELLLPLPLFLVNTKKEFRITYAVFSSFFILASVLLLWIHFKKRNG